MFFHSYWDIPATRQNLPKGHWFNRFLLPGTPIHLHAGVSPVRAPWVELFWDFSSTWRPSERAPPTDVPPSELFSQYVYIEPRTLSLTLKPHDFAAIICFWWCLHLETFTSLTWLNTVNSMEWNDIHPAIHPFVPKLTTGSLGKI